MNENLLECIAGAIELGGQQEARNGVEQSASQSIKLMHSNTTGKGTANIGVKTSVRKPTTPPQIG